MLFFEIFSGVILAGAMLLLMVGMALTIMGEMQDEEEKKK